jgi:DNA-binding response OmpR family regulator
MNANDEVRVLVVDDDDALRRVLCRTLQLAGYAVMGAEGMAAALRYAERTFDLLVLDHVLPNGDGRALAAQWPGAAVLTISGFPEQDPDLAKPFGTTTLLAAVAAKLNGHAREVSA